MEKKALCSALHDLEAAVANGDDQFANFTGSNPMTNTYFWSTAYRWIGRDCRMPDPGMYVMRA